MQRPRCSCRSCGPRPPESAGRSLHVGPDGRLVDTRPHASTASCRGVGWVLGRQRRQSADAPAQQQRRKGGHLLRPDGSRPCAAGEPCFAPCSARRARCSASGTRKSGGTRIERDSTHFGQNARTLGSTRIPVNGPSPYFGLTKERQKHSLKYLHNPDGDRRSHAHPRDRLPATPSYGGDTRPMSRRIHT